MDVTDPLVFFAAKNISAGTPLTICYGNRSNIQLMQMYGFVMERNPFDNYSLTIDGEVYIST